MNDDVNDRLTVKAFCPRGHTLAEVRIRDGVTIYRLYRLTSKKPTVVSSPDPRVSLSFGWRDPADDGRAYSEYREDLLMGDNVSAECRCVANKLGSYVIPLGALKSAAARHTGTKPVKIRMPARDGDALS